MNNRKITFDKMCRQLLLDICELHWLDVETEAIYGGKANRDKNDYIIEAQRVRIAELEKQNAAMTHELNSKLEKLSDVNAALEAVTDTAYKEAIKVVAKEAIQQTQKEHGRIINWLLDKVMSSETKLRKNERDQVQKCLEAAAMNIKKKPSRSLKRS